MDPAFLNRQFLLKRQVLALTGIFRIYNPSGGLLFYSRQKMFRLKEDISVFSDEASTRPVLRISARQVIDFSAAYDVVDVTTGEQVGAIQRQGWRSLARDEWHFFSPLGGAPLAILQEDSLGRALLRRYLLHTLLPLDYHLASPTGGAIGSFHQRFNPLRFVLELNLEGNDGQLDPRLAIAALVLLAAVEGRQFRD